MVKLKNCPNIFNFKLLFQNNKKILKIVRVPPLKMKKAGEKCKSRKNETP
jgi:hypothetical protein